MTPIGYWRELLAAGAVLSVPVLVLPMAFLLPGVVVKVMTYWLAYVLTWADNHGKHALIVLFESQFMAVARSVCELFGVECHVTAFDYWAFQGFVLTWLVTRVCLGVQRRAEDLEEDDEDDVEAVMGVDEKVKEVSPILQQVVVEGNSTPTRYVHVTTVTTVTYTVEVMDTRHITH